MINCEVRYRTSAIAGAVAASLLLVTACSSSSGGSGGSSSGGLSPTGGNAGGGPTSVASSAPATSKAPSGSPYVIGQIGTFSGPYASSDIGAHDALDAWVKYTNAHGGINGHPVQLIQKDDQLNAALALTEAKQLVGAHVLAIVGVNSIVEDSFASYIDSGSTPVIGDDLSKDIMGKYKHFYPEGTTRDANYYYGVPREAVLQGATKIGVIYCAESTACSQIADGVKQQSGAAGGSFAFATAASATSTSYTAQCLTAKSSGASAIELTLNEEVAARVAEACEQQGYHPQWIQGSNGFTQSETTVSALDGVAGPVPDFPWFASDTPAEKIFQAAMHQYEPQDFKSDANGYSEAASLGWASGEIFGAAAKGLKGMSNPTSVDLEKQLSKLPAGDTFGGLTPPIHYVANGPQPAVNCFFGIKLKDGKYSVLHDGKTICQK